MRRILLKTTIGDVADDWHVGRFAMLTAHLRALRGADGRVLYDVEARNRVEDGAGRDVDLRAAEDGAFDQLWLLAVDVTGALSRGDVEAIDAFRRRGGGLLLTRDHQDLGSCLANIPVVGASQHYQTTNPETDPGRRHVDDVGTPKITWPNYHSGRNGDAQRIHVVEPVHPVVRRADGSPIAWLPAHPHEGTVGTPPALGEAARVVATGRSATTGAAFNLVVAIEAGARSGGGRVVADSSFHHFSDCNWDPAAGAPSFVDEPWGEGMMKSPEAQADARQYATNVAAWLAGA